MLKKEKLVQFNRHNILDAAKRIFAGKGMDGTTMDDIAREAESSKSTVYVYFKNKEEIYNSIVLEHMILLRDALTDAMEAESDFEVRYYAMCKTFVLFSERYPLYFESILGKIDIEEEEMNQKPVLREIYNVGEQTNALVRKLLADGIQTGYLRKDILPVPTALILTAGIGALISLADKKEHYVRRDLNIEKLDFLLYGFDLLLSSIRRLDL